MLLGANFHSRFPKRCNFLPQGPTYRCPFKEPFEGLSAIRQCSQTILCGFFGKLIDVFNVLCGVTVVGQHLKRPQFDGSQGNISICFLLFFLAIPNAIATGADFG